MRIAGKRPRKKEPFEKNGKEKNVKNVTKGRDAEKKQKKNVKYVKKRNDGKKMSKYYE